MIDKPHLVLARRCWAPAWASDCGLPHAGETLAVRMPSAANTSVAAQAVAPDAALHYLTRMRASPATTISPDLAEDGLPVPQRYWSMLTLMVGLAMSVLDTAIVNVALPVIAKDMHANAADAIWVVNAYQLAVLVSLLPFASFGEFSDIAGSTASVSSSTRRRH